MKIRITREGIEEALESDTSNGTIDKNALLLLTNNMSGRIKLLEKSKMKALVVEITDLQDKEKSVLLKPILCRVDGLCKTIKI